MPLTFTIVICAYTLERWELLLEAVDSARAQAVRPNEVIVCVDHNDELAERCRGNWEADELVTVIENRYPGRLGSSRNSGLELATGDVIAFLDDDAVASEDWLARLGGVYESGPGVEAVGGGPLPRFETERPRWFPFEFDWVFGCAYRGLPQQRAATGRVIGASMSVRREAAMALAGFHSDDHDDMDLSHRLLNRYGPRSVVYDPTIQVSHFVTGKRVTWGYFWRRCFTVNRGKVLAVKDMEGAGNHDADFAFVRYALLRALPGYLLHPRDGGWLRAAALLVGIACAALGNLVGHVGLLIGTTPPSLTRGLQADQPTFAEAARVGAQLWRES